MKNKMCSRMIPKDGETPITHTQLFVLGIIKKHKNSGVGDVANHLNISPSAATQLVDALVKKKYVIRKTNDNDRRASQLELSETGQKYITNMKNKRMEMITILFDELDDQELEIYLKIQEKILNKMNEKE